MAKSKSFIKSIVFILMLVIFSGGIMSSKVYAYDNIVVVIDPGHGGVVTEENNNGGAIYNGVQEKDVDLITARALYDELSQYKNVTVYMTRTEDIDLSLDARVDFATSVNADVLVSVHYNASADHNFYGSEIFTSMYGEARATGYALAQCVMKKWNAFGSASKGIKTRQGKNGDYYGLIRKGYEKNLPVVILEHGYLDCDRDFSRMNSIEKWQELGALDAAGIAEYYGIHKDVVKEKITPTVHVTPLSDPVLPDTTPPENVKLVVDSYDYETGELKYSISAAEPEDTLMYYGLKTGVVSESTVYEDLEAWDNTTGIQKGVFMAPKRYSGEITARVYNTYELYSDSLPVELSKEGVAESKEESMQEDDAKSEDVKNAGDDAPGGDGSDGNDGDLADGGNDKNTIIRKEIPIGNESAAGEKIEITPRMVEDAMNKTSESSKSLLGLIIAGCVVGFVLLVVIALLVIKLVDGTVKKKNKKGRGRGRHRADDWRDEQDEYGHYY